VLSEHPDTVAVHAGRLEIPANTASSPPLFQASSYEFADLADVEAIYQGERRGAIYGRYGGPNTAQFERAIAELEGAEAAVGAAAGVAAINAALATNLRAGDTVLAGRELYGGTYSLLENDYRTRGVDVAYVDQQDLRAVAAALQQARPKVLYLEALTNPLMRVPDLAALAQLGHEAGAVVVVDATFATPILLRPLDLGRRRRPRRPGRPRRAGSGTAGAHRRDATALRSVARAAWTAHARAAHGAALEQRRRGREFLGVVTARPTRPPSFAPESSRARACEAALLTGNGRHRCFRPHRCARCRSFPTWA